MAVVFEIDRESSQSIDKELLLLPSLEELELRHMHTLTHVWKCNWNEFLILHMKHQPQSSSSFQNLTTIKLFSCKSIKYLFSPLMANLLSNLKTIYIRKCNGMEEVVSSRDDDAHEDLHVQLNTTTLFPHLVTLTLRLLSNLKRIGGAGVVAKGSTSSICDNHSKFSQACVVSWSLCQYARDITISDCPSMVEVFETSEMNTTGYSSCPTLTIPRPNDITMHKLSNLKILNISQCHRLEFIFPFSALESLSQLEKLTIKKCEAMQVIAREEIGEQISRSNKVVVFPRLELIELECLPNLAGFFLGKNNFERPLLNLEETLLSSSHGSFCNLKILRVSNCENLKFLFMIPVANGMTELENLTVSSCRVLKSLIHIENNGVREISFPKLKSLTLEKLPNLVTLCGCVMNVMDLPQLTDLVLDDLPNITSIFPGNNNMASTQLFLSKKAVIPKLEKLEIRRMEKLKQIWSSSSDRDEEVGYSISMLRKIRVEECDGLVDMFPSNPMGLLSQLEELKVENCWSIEVLFNIDLGKTQQLSNKSSLRRIYVDGLKKLREVWSIKDAENNSPPLPIHSFQSVEFIYIEGCEKFRNLFTPTTAHFDLGALKEIVITHCGEEGSWENNAELVEKNSQEQEINVESEGEVEMSSKVGDRKSSHVAFSSHQLTHTFHQLRMIYFNKFKGMEVVFEIDRESSQSINKELLLLPSLEKLELRNMETLTHVWKCNWNEFLILHMKHQPQSSSSFQNLTTINLYSCKSIKYLFSPLMANLLSNLNTIHIWWCDGMEEVVSSRDDDDAHEDLHVQMKITPLFPHLQTLELWSLPNLKHIGGAGVVARGSTTSIGDNDSKFSSTGVVSWSLYQYAREISIRGCPSMVEVFESREMINNSGYDSCTNVNQGSTDHDTTLVIPRPKDITMHKLSNLKILKISQCDRLEFIFPFSALECLRQLEELTIEQCEAMKVLVLREENGEQISGSNKVVVFPRLESIKLEGLPNLAGLFLGKNDFEWPLLNFVSIKDCSQIKVVTYGESRAPQLNYIYTELGKHECDFNFHLPLTSTLHQTPLSSL